MASVHLSSSKHWHLSQPSTVGEVIAFRCSPRRRRLPLDSILLEIFSPFAHLSTPRFSCLLFFFLSHLTFHAHRRCRVLSVEQPIQQLNKAAYSITRRLIKQDQNAAALWLWGGAEERAAGQGNAGWHTAQNMDSRLIVEIGVFNSDAGSGPQWAALQSPTAPHKSHL